MTLLIEQIEPARPASPFPTDGVIRVGGGRGFVVCGKDERRYIITAAHCIPEEHYPFPHLSNSSNELAVRDIVGDLGCEECSIRGELCVLNLTDDLAVLAEPDSQNMPEEHDRYETFTTAKSTVQIGPPPLFVPPYEWLDVPGAPAWVLSLDLSWQPCTVHTNGRWLTLYGAKIEGGMSGSPILNAKGEAIGLISTSSEPPNDVGFGSNVPPSLMDCLPPWLWRELDFEPEKR